MVGRFDSGAPIHSNRFTDPQSPIIRLRAWNGENRCHGFEATNHRLQVEPIQQRFRSFGSNSNVWQTCRHRTALSFVTEFEGIFFLKNNQNFVLPSITVL